MADDNYDDLNASGVRKLVRERNLPNVALGGNVHVLKAALRADDQARHTEQPTQPPPPPPQLPTGQPATAPPSGQEMATAPIPPQPQQQS